MGEGYIALRDYDSHEMEGDENSNHQLRSSDNRRGSRSPTSWYRDVIQKRPKAILSIALVISVLVNVCFLAILLRPRSNVIRFNETPAPSSECPPQNTGSGLEIDKITDKKQSTVGASTNENNKAISSSSIPSAQCPPENVPPCQRDNPSSLHSYTAVKENIFEDLSALEIQAVYNYLAKHPDFKVNQQAESGSSHVYGIELHVPNKTEALKFIDGQGPKPAREARVVVQRMDLRVPEIQELVVGPLPSPTYHRAYPRLKSGPIPYRFFPSYGLREAVMSLTRLIVRNRDFNRLIKESYRSDFVNCGSQCLTFVPQRTSSAYSATSLIVLSVHYAADFVTIHPVGLIFVMKELKENSLKFSLHAVHYAGQTYKSIRALTTAYTYSSTPKARMTFPVPKPPGTTIPGTMNFKGRKFPSTPQAGPVEYEPQGKRYKITGQHVQYLDWSFSLRMSTASGPQLWDIQWAGERIAYEISLQEVGVIYAGANPTTYYTHLSDSAFGLGSKSQGLVRGVDCPEHATFLPQTVFNETSGTSRTMLNAICVFEHNEGRPLRRHKSSDDNNGWNYGGLVDRVLIVRSIIVEYNYDYIFDAVFHQNGALELKTYATGYVMSQAYYGAEDKFGFKITDTIVGSIHHHVFHFKVDLDIQGQSNRYETLDFTTDSTNWPWRTTSFAQIAFEHNLKKTETEALYRYNFNTPKYHIVYNDEKKNIFGNHRAYRVDAKGFSYQLLPDDSPVLKSRRWTQYQIVTTKHKETERASSSLFSMFDGDDPVVDFDQYWKDNDNLVDQDLVMWITVGMHHIPHTEDIPNTPTVGTEATITLSPYNYFTECPSLGSRDAVRADLTGGQIVLKEYTLPNPSSCLPEKFDLRTFFKNRDNVFL